MGSNETVYFDQTGPTEKSAWSASKGGRIFFRNFSSWTEPIHSVLGLNFQTFWLNGGIFHLEKNSENFYWEFPFRKNAFHLSQVPFVQRPLSVASPNNRCLSIKAVLPFSRTRFSSSLSRQTNASYRHIVLSTTSICGYEKSDICILPSVMFSGS